MLRKEANFLPVLWNKQPYSRGVMTSSCTVILNRCDWKGRAPCGGLNRMMSRCCVFILKWWSEDVFLCSRDICAHTPARLLSPLKDLRTRRAGITKRVAPIFASIADYQKRTVQTWTIRCELPSRLRDQTSHGVETDQSAIWATQPAEHQLLKKSWKIQSAEEWLPHSSGLQSENLPALNSSG